MKRHYEIELLRVVEVTERCCREVEADSYDDAIQAAKAIICADWVSDDKRVIVDPFPAHYGDPYWREDAESEDATKGSQ